MSKPNLGPMGVFHGFPLNIFNYRTFHPKIIPRICPRFFPSHQVIFPQTLCPKITPKITLQQPHLGTAGRRSNSSDAAWTMLESQGRYNRMGDGNPKMQSLQFRFAGFGDQKLTHRDLDVFRQHVFDFNG